MATGEIPTRYRLRVKQRLTIVMYAEDYGVKPAGRHFGLNRKTVRIWRDRWRQDGEQGLLPRYPARRKRRRLDDRMIGLIKQARIDHRYGAGRARIWLERVHQIRVTARTLQRVFRDLGVPYLTKTPRRRPRQLKLFEKDDPGDSVQVDVKVVTRGRRKWFQYTAIDDCTRLRVLRLFRRQNQQSSLAFLHELQHEFPFPIRKIQVDNGTEFSLAFALTCQELGIRVRYIKPRRPQQNGKVERSHRIDDEEFWTAYAGEDFDDATRELARWEHRYNHERFSMALAGRTPMEKLTLVLARRPPPPAMGSITTVQWSEHAPS
jgi:transposase InsO family protein